MDVRRGRGAGRGAMLALLLAATAWPAWAQWEPQGVLRVPSMNYLFLAATPAGDLLAATFNTASVDSPPRDIPALLIRNPTSPQPEVIELLRVPFGGQRGFGGVACDSYGNIYLSGDTGAPSTCFLRKFTPDGKPDSTFGQNGVVMPQRRCLGLDIFGDYLVLAVDWCQLQVYSATSGQLLFTGGKGPADYFVRDVAIDPVSLRIYGVAAGRVVVWDSGMPWEPGSYVFRPVTPAAGTVRSGEGISLDPIKRQAIISPAPGNTLYEVNDQGSAVRTIDTAAEPTHHLADTVVSFDGSKLFVSDLTTGQIHVLTRNAPETSTPVGTRPPDNGTGGTSPGLLPTASPSPTTPPISQGSGQPTPVTWHRSYQEIVEQARRGGQPMIVYFRMNGVAKCDEVEKSILLTPEFNRRAANFACVFEDIAFNRLLAYRFGVFRVPYIVVLNRRGEIVFQAIYNIDANALAAAIASAR